jgi:hypothetical protein
MNIVGFSAGEDRISQSGSTRNHKNRKKTVYSGSSGTRREFLRGVFLSMQKHDPQRGHPFLGNGISNLFGSFRASAPYPSNYTPFEPLLLQEKTDRFRRSCGISGMSKRGIPANKINAVPYRGRATRFSFPSFLKCRSHLLIYCSILVDTALEFIHFGIVPFYYNNMLNPESVSLGSLLKERIDLVEPCK